MSSQSKCTATHQNLLAQDHSASVKGLLPLLHINAFRLLEDIYFIFNLLIWLGCLWTNINQTFSPLANKDLFLFNSSSIVSHRQINSELLSLTCEPHHCLTSLYLSKSISNYLHPLFCWSHSYLSITEHLQSSLHSFFHPMFPGTFHLSP